MAKLTANKISQALDISVNTLGTWYKWFNDPDIEKPEDMPTLPPFEQAYPRAPRYWDSKDIKQLKRFKAWVPKGRGGLMGKYNKRYWGMRNQINGGNN